ncbi:hypothetical protein TSH100_11160 [Azospirillum sp. TSH100]|uniref:hypothetical protein n=1 Tax=Azospirillum sp. TSH100 TaxID=652764 RepID=UPI000D60716E|nr:hypothetical protein [Azospirillum sp. TSH100]PWC86941.1 hypothetical protein TSH100_11160 [Azospirillum sp. TSH100]QCG91573.1 hypothetical protein E6C72_27725 [Azospirillum sp. TSH100]
MDRPHLAPVVRLRPALRGRRDVRAATPLALLACLALALSACETVPPPPAAAPSAAALPDGPVRPFSSGKGWTVTIHTPPGDKSFCVAERGIAVGQNAAPRLTFRTAAAESGFILSGFTPSDSGATVKPGERYDLTVTSDLGSRLSLSARGLPNGSLYVAVPTKGYLEEMEPLARAHRVSFRSSGLGEIGTMLLSGSSWAINASDECRILHAES